MHRFCLAASLLMLGLLPVSESFAQSRQPQTPNIVFLLTDDVGWNKLYDGNDTFYETPHLDTLRQQGMTFRDAYTSAAVCSPTRAALLSGKNPAQLHLTDWIPGNVYGEYRLDQPNWQPFLPLEERTIGEAFHDAGYATGYFGKWHLSQAKKPPESRSHNPDKQGFDEQFITYKPKPPILYPWQDAEDDAHNTDMLTGHALRFVERHRKEPFLLFVGYNAVHTPLKESKKNIAKYANKPNASAPENNPTLAAMLQRVDHSVGAIRDAIDRLGLSRETIFIFYSDNGGNAGASKQSPLREGKGWLYEGGVRVPLIVRWPGVTSPGSTTDAQVISTDFYPTLLDMIGNDPAPAKKLDGESFTPVLRDPIAAVRDTLYWHYPHYHEESGMKPGGAIRVGDYKLIEWYEPLIMQEGKKTELYNVAKDPGEQHDLSDERPQKAEALLQALRAWRDRVGAQMPTPNADFHEGKRP